MRIALGSDHRGVDLKDDMIASLQKRGIESDDCGPNGPESTDYPDYAQRVGMLVGEGEADGGILICGTGLGMSIAANKVPRVRAALCITPLMAERARQHNNANVLVLAGDLTTPEEADAILDAWLGAEFESAVRHKRRIKKIHMGEQSLVDPLAIYEEDTEIHAAISAEARRQSGTINLCASENIVSRAVREAQGSILTNKYADGYPGKRLHADCEYADDVERLAVDRAMALFGAEHANVQPYSGSLANEAVYLSVLEPGDTILSMSLEHGGHITHGHPGNLSGRLYDVVTYGVNRETEQIDYDEVAKLAAKSKPRLIIAGCSFYSRIIDFQKLRTIADSAGAYLHADMAHIAGLVAAGCHPSPVPLSEFVTASTHKTLRGPRGGMILCQARFAEEIDRQVFPGLQGGPLLHVIAAKAVCFHEATRPSFKKYQQQVIRNAKALASGIADRGIRIVSGGTDNHMVLVDVGSAGTTGKEVAGVLRSAGISANKCLVPFDQESPFVTSGIRLGTAHVTARGMGEDEMAILAELVADLATGSGKKPVTDAAHSKVADLASRFPVS